MMVIARHPIACFFFLVAVSVNTQARSIPLIDFTILATENHNPQSFTQGWVKEDDTFYESSGLYGRSFIQRYNQHSTETRQLPKRYFAEGLTLWNNKLYLLTWREKTLLVINKHSLATEKTLPYKGEGWGLTHNGKYLIKSNGTAQLTLHEPGSFTRVKTLKIPHVKQLNELEYTKGILWANDWKTDKIYAINMEKACIIGVINLTTLRKNTVHPDARNVLNGIAYDSTHNALWVTGKYWPKRYLLSNVLLNTHSQDC